MKTTGGHIFGLVAATAGLILCVNAPVSAHEGDVCLRIADLEQIHMMNDLSAVASARQAVFNVTFRVGCTAASNAAYFIFQPDRLGPCLDARDVLETSDGTACVIEKVIRLRDIPLQDAQ